MVSPLRVGIIGANAGGGWAGDSHVPAVQGTDGLELWAVATNRQDTADEAAHAFGVARAYASGAALIADPEIDIVTVATRVPDHRELVLAAIAAGKHVYSEWPLGRSSAEADEMARAADAAGVQTAIGLQLRQSPAVRAAQSRLAAGAIGRILSVRAFSSTAGFGPEVPAPFVYLEDPASFANLVTIQGAHTLDLVLALGGAATECTALLSRQFLDIRLVDGGTTQRQTTFDHMLVQDRLASGAPFSAEIAGGRTGETPFSMEIVGERGSLRLDGGAPRGLQSGLVGLAEGGKRVSVPATGDLPDPAVNVAGVYTALHDGIEHGAPRAASFHQAVDLTRMIEALLTSAETGGRLQADGWPMAKALRPPQRSSR